MFYLFSNKNANDMLSRHTKVSKVNDNVDLRQDCQLWIRCITENEIHFTGMYTLLNR